MYQQAPEGTERFARSVWNLYCSLEKKFGVEKAWAFIMNFYAGAGR